jgi:hypothetical protein
VVLHFSVRFGSSAGSLTSTLNVQKSKFSQNFLQKPLLNEYKTHKFGFYNTKLWAIWFKRGRIFLKKIFLSLQE